MSGPGPGILLLQILLSRAKEDYPARNPPPLRFIRSCSSSLAAPTLHKLEATFHVPVLEVDSPSRTCFPKPAPAPAPGIHGALGGLVGPHPRTCCGRW